MAPFSSDLQYAVRSCRLRSTKLVMSPSQRSSTDAPPISCSVAARPAANSSSSYMQKMALFARRLGSCRLLTPTVASFALRNFKIVVVVDDADYGTPAYWSCWPVRLDLTSPTWRRTAASASVSKLAFPHSRRWTGTKCREEAQVRVAGMGSGFPLLVSGFPGALPLSLHPALKSSFSMSTVTSGSSPPSVTPIALLADTCSCAGFRRSGPWVDSPKPFAFSPSLIPYDQRSASSILVTEDRRKGLQSRTSCDSISYAT